MTYKVQLTKQACKDLDTLDDTTLGRMKSAINRLARNPVPGRRFLGGSNGECFYEICRHLIVYQISGEKIVVLMIRPFD